MKKYRYERLVECLEKYDVDIKTGTIKNKKKDYPVKGSLTEKGYKYLFFRYRGRDYRYKFHEVIAVAGGLDVIDKTINHKDGNKINNSIDNLEVMTVIENLLHAWKTGLYDNMVENRNIRSKERIV